MPTISDAVTKAFQACQTGEFEQSEWWCHQVLQYDPSRSEILNLLGSLCHQTGRSTTALTWYRKAIEVSPNYAEAYNNLGVVLHALGHLDIALAQFEAAVAIQPDYAQAYFNWGNALSEDGQFETAEVAYQTALELQPNYTAAQNNLANLLQSIGDYQRSIALYRQSIAQNPTSANAHMNLANLLQEQCNIEGAMVHYEKAFALDPSNPDLAYNLGLARERSGHPQQAIRTYYQALQLNSRQAESHYRLGCLLKLDRPTEALAHLQQAISYRPDFAEAFNAIGQVWHDRMELSAAITSFQQAIVLDPDFAEAHVNLAEALLLNGDYAKGFVEYEWRWQSQTYLVTQLPRHRSMLQWDGSTLNNKKILLWAEQGISQTLQFVRFVAAIAAMGGEIYLECDRHLVDLLQNLPGVKQLIPRGEPVPKCDYQSSLISLPRILNTTLETIPKRPDLGIAVTPPKQIQKVGVAVSEDCLAILQSQLSKRGSLEIIELPTAPENTSYAEIAATIAGLDLVIATDQPIAHLAASLGQQTYILLEYAPAWIWLSDRADSPWYPTVQLFRQTQPGDWTAAIERCINVL